MGRDFHAPDELVPLLQRWKGDQRFDTNAIRGRAKIRLVNIHFLVLVCIVHEENLIAKDPLSSLAILDVGDGGLNALSLGKQAHGRTKAESRTGSGLGPRETGLTQSFGILEHRRWNPRENWEAWRYWS